MSANVTSCGINIFAASVFCAYIKYQRGFFRWIWLVCCALRIFYLKYRCFYLNIVLTDFQCDEATNVFWLELHCHSQNRNTSWFVCIPATVITLLNIRWLWLFSKRVRVIKCQRLAYFSSVSIVRLKWNKLRFIVACVETRVAFCKYA